MHWDQDEIKLQDLVKNFALGMKFVDGLSKVEIST